MDVHQSGFILAPKAASQGLVKHKGGDYARVDKIQLDMSTLGAISADRFSEANHSFFFFFFFFFFLSNFDLTSKLTR